MVIEYVEKAARVEAANVPARGFIASMLLDDLVSRNVTFQWIADTETLYIWNGNTWVAAKNGEHVIIFDNDGNGAEVMNRDEFTERYQVL